MTTIEVTPNRYRAQRKQTRECVEAYKTARAKALAVRREWIAAGRLQNGKWMITREESVGAACEARFWALTMIKRLAGLTPVTGAAWSDRGLANVRASNARR